MGSSTIDPCRPRRRKCTSARDDRTRPWPPAPREDVALPPSSQACGLPATHSSGNIVVGVMLRVVVARVKVLPQATRIGAMWGLAFFLTWIVV